MRALLKIADVLSWVCKQVARVVGLLLIVLTAVVIYDVIGRRYFAVGSFVLQELEWHLHGALAVLCFGYAYTRDAHVRIDIFATSMSDRFKLVLEIIGNVFFLLPFMLLLLFYGYDFAEHAFRVNETSPGGLGLSNRWIIKSAVPLSALLAIFGSLAVTFRCVVALRRPDLLSTPFEDGALWRP